MQVVDVFVGGDDVIAPAVCPEPGIGRPREPDVAYGSAVGGIVSGGMAVCKHDLIVV